MYVAYCLTIAVFVCKKAGFRAFSPPARGSDSEQLTPISIQRESRQSATHYRKHEQNAYLTCPKKISYFYLLE
jgi:hypothetical protein